MYPNSLNTQITLLTIASVTDSIGVKKTIIKTAHEVFGTSKSITSTEYATQTAINKELDFKVSIQAFLYKNEKYALVNDVIYKIERTYLNGQFIELYLKESEYKWEELNGIS